MKRSSAFFAAACVMCSMAQAQSPGAGGMEFKFTTLRAGGDNFKTVYFGHGVRGAVKVCTTTKGVHVYAYSTGTETNVSTVTNQNECTVVVGDKVTVVPYVVQEPSATVLVTVLGVAGVHDAAP